LHTELQAIALVRGQGEREARTPEHYIFSLGQSYSQSWWKRCEPLPSQHLLGWTGRKGSINSTNESTSSPYQQLWLISLPSEEKQSSEKEVIL